MMSNEDNKGNWYESDTKHQKDDDDEWIETHVGCGLPPFRMKKSELPPKPTTKYYYIMTEEISKALGIPFMHRFAPYITSSEKKPDPSIVGHFTMVEE